MAPIRYPLPDTIRHPKKRAWLKAFALCGTVRRACAAAKIHHSTFYEWRRIDPEFADAAEEAREYHIEWLEEEVDRRAVQGVPRYRFYKGQPVIDPATGQPYVEHEYSDNLLMFRLKALRPEMYRERYEPKVSDQEIEREIERTIEQLTAQAAAQPCRHCKERNGECDAGL